jgi:16S rRNA (guanine527-N7)-methyltransferase
MVKALMAAFAAAGYPIEEAAAKRMERYHGLVADANRSMNLTAIESMDEAVTLHFLDSASPLFSGFLKKGDRCADVGSGAGFPGVVLAILRPDCSFVLMDALSKRVGFLCSVIDALGLDNVSALHVRAEDAGRDRQHREAYDVVFSRAVARLSVLCEYCLPLVRVSGSMIAFKGPDAAAEAEDAVRAASMLGAPKIEVVDAGIPGRSHRLVRLEKRFATPAAYPRKAGLPKRQPL